METSLRANGESKALRIHVKEKFPNHSHIFLQVHGELDTTTGRPSYLCGMLRHFYPDLSASIGVGLRCDSHNKLQFNVRGKKAYPVTADGPFSFHIKGQCDADKELKENKSTGALEFSWTIFNIKKDQDVRLKVGYEILEKVPYLQIRENKWTLNTDINGRWNFKYDL